MRKKRSKLVAVIVLGALAAYYVGSEIYYARSISPDGVSTVHDFFERFGAPRRIHMIARDGQSFYELTGHLPSRWVFAVPSGPPTYVFDERGRFVAWCSDPGDDPGYRRDWQHQSPNEVDVGLVKQKFGL
jgi:hypothetical protein